jgi:hypothetical protein
MQPVLIDGGELVPQSPIQKFNNSCIASHVEILGCWCGGTASRHFSPADGAE